MRQPTVAAFSGAVSRRTEAVATIHAGRKFVALPCLSILLAVVCARPVLAQAIHEGKLTGHVSTEDRSTYRCHRGGLEPQLLGGKRSTTTSADGAYLFLNLPAGRYEVTLSLAGFKTIVRQNIGVRGRDGDRRRGPARGGAHRDDHRHGR